MTVKKSKKKSVRKVKNKMGRKTVFTQEVLQKLEEAFFIGSDDVSACFNAGIAPSSLYNYQNKHPEFLERKTYLKKNPSLIARRNIYKALQSGDIEVSKWYLGKKERNEFGDSVQIENITPPKIIDDLGDKECG